MTKEALRVMDHQPSFGWGSPCGLKISLSDQVNIQTNSHFDIKTLQFMISNLQC